MPFIETYSKIRTFKICSIQKGLKKEVLTPFISIFDFENAIMEVEEYLGEFKLNGRYQVNLC
jgi:hypothetical protein